MVNIIIRYDTNIQHVIHSFPSLLPLSQKCRINILLKITTYVLKSSLLLQKFSHSDGLRASKVWNQPSGFLKLRSWFDQYRSLQICFECRQFCHPVHFKILKKAWKTMICPLPENMTSVTEHRACRLWVLCSIVYPDQYENLWKSCKHKELDSYVFQENPSVQWTLDYWNIANIAE